MRKLILSFVALMTSFCSMASIWYVSADGDDSADGKTLKTAFRSLQKAADIVNPGDEVLIGDGVYSSNEKYENSAVLRLHRSGTPDAWITWKALPGARPVIRPLDWCGIMVTGCYNVIDGITIMGLNDEISLVEALADSKKDTPSGRFNTNGIYFNGRLCPPESKPHHLIIRNSTIRKCPGGGITAIEFDYLTVEDCVVAENCWSMRYAGSGITTLDNWSYDDAPGYHVIIRRNYVWNNKTLIPWARTGKHSDGNGILMDVTKTEGAIATNPNGDAIVDGSDSDNAKRKTRPVWKGRSLIANNVSAYNGGSGIHTFQTRGVDIVNNTTYHNGCVVNYEELFPNCSQDITIKNNIIVPRPGGRVTSDNKNTDIHWDYNLYPVKQDIFVGENDIVADPAFVNVCYELTEGGFMLKKGSPGRRSGTDDVAQPTDIRNKARKDGRRDRGAYQQ